MAGQCVPQGPRFLPALDKIREGIYAYDAYFLDCAVRYRAPLLTLDRPLKRAAEGLGVKLLNLEA